MINTIFVKFNLENTLNLIHEFLANVSNLMRFTLKISKFNCLISMYN